MKSSSSGEELFAIIFCALLSLLVVFFVSAI